MTFEELKKIGAGMLGFTERPYAKSGEPYLRALGLPTESIDELRAYIQSGMAPAQKPSPAKLDA